MLLRNERIYYSAEYIECDNNIDKSQFPTEFLHNLTSPGMPPHELALKTGVIIMLLCTISLNEGLCNDTRLIVHHLHHHSIDAKILTGWKAGVRMLILRIKLNPSDIDLPFVLCRHQFPVRLL